MEAAKSKRILKLFTNSINHLLWPAVCINCRWPITDSNDKLCNNCWGELLACTTGSCCPRCGRTISAGGIVDNACPACQGQDFHFDALVGCGIYGGALRSMILAFKNSRCELASTLGGIAQTAFHSSGFAYKVDYFVPVPLHWRKRLVRGYNQSTLIAKILCTNGKKLNTDLVRIRNTAAQPSMSSPAARARNVADAFAVRKGQDFTNKTICLIDDIKTTGATLNECAKTLKAAGAKYVYALVLAVADQNPG